MLVNGKQMHIAIGPGDVGRYVILPGDPGRCEKIAQYFDNPQFVASNREFTVYTGTLLGETVSVCSTGIGGPSTAIAVEELIECGADTFIRLGTCGGIKLEVQGGDVIIATGAVRQDGTSMEYMPAHFPAVANLDVACALRDAARAKGLTHHCGIVPAKDAFSGQHAPDQMPTGPYLHYQWDCWKKGNVLASEMESSTLFVVASVRDVRAGALFHAIWNQERGYAGLPNPSVHDMTPTLETAIEGLKLLIRRDRGEQV